MTTTSPRWFTSSYSNNGGNCVEVATNLVGSCGAVPVRDSKQSGGPELSVRADGWVGFVSAVRTGRVGTS